eukprot:NODE_772_length_1650_cov_25.263296_g762_i0.p1 GENE.NODE_772_length_1650_cov_25.263296_g762_i0~~NODE_772_length_1650_cov_25.263296_g762_i0.p1  ORF type:complete len:544 (-),score=73.21 NODE_772_length_1650_cov_25.263296_g762_i0:18-1502(-)
MGTVRNMLRTIVTAVSELHELGYLHADLKPENVLFTSSTAVKSDIDPGPVAVIDFGSARNTTKDELRGLIQTRHYRAPEVIFGLAFSKSADIFSIGTLAVELALGSPMFLTHDEKEHMHLMKKWFGGWNCRYAQLCSRNVKAHNHISQATGRLDAWTDAELEMQQYCDSFQDLRAALSFSAEFYDFVQCCTQYEPTCRWTAAQLLLHPFMQGTKAPADYQMVLPSEVEWNWHSPFECLLVERAPSPAAATRQRLKSKKSSLVTGSRRSERARGRDEADDRESRRCASVARRQARDEDDKHRSKTRSNRRDLRSAAPSFRSEYTRSDRELSSWERRHEYDRKQRRNSEHSRHYASSSSSSSSHKHHSTSSNNSSSRDHRDSSRDKRHSSGDNRSSRDSHYTAHRDARDQRDHRDHRDYRDHRDQYNSSSRATSSTSRHDTWRAPQAAVAWPVPRHSAAAYDKGYSQHHHDHDGKSNKRKLDGECESQPYKRPKAY